MIRHLGSARLALGGFALLALAVTWSYQRPEASPWLVAAPMLFLGLNLLCALVAYPRLRRDRGLLVFHLGLLGLLVLAAAGRLTHLNGRIEIAEGQAYEPAALEVTGAGPLHSGAFRSLAFSQGSWSVDYHPGVRRSHTRSQVSLPDGSQAVAGDDDALILSGYRFYTTHNKGFAPEFSWTPAGGQTLVGLVHMPPYPLFDWKQENRWTPPGGPGLQLWLHLTTPLDEDARWTLSPATVRGELTVAWDGGSRRLAPGGEIQLPGGVLRYQGLRGWMGYKVFYDPTLPWLFWLALLSVAGLALHVWGRLADEAGADAPTRASSLSAGLDGAALR